MSEGSRGAPERRWEWSHERIQRIKAEQGGVVDDYLALSQGSDPFYSGSPADVRWAEWFAGLWRNLRLAGKKIHLRGMHYKIVTGEIGDVTLPDGKRYLNTE
jgi:hypothetical protein